MGSNVPPNTGIRMPQEPLRQLVAALFEKAETSARARSARARMRLQALPAPTPEHALAACCP